MFWNLHRDLEGFTGFNLFIPSFPLMSLREKHLARVVLQVFNLLPCICGGGLHKGRTDVLKSNSVKHDTLARKRFLTPGTSNGISRSVAIRHPHYGEIAFCVREIYSSGENVEAAMSECICKPCMISQIAVHEGGFLVFPFMLHLYSGRII